MYPAQFRIELSDVDLESYMTATFEPIVGLGLGDLCAKMGILPMGWVSMVVRQVFFPSLNEHFISTHVC